MDIKQQCQNPKCGKELPILNNKGENNFCPQVQKDEKTIINICMKCKMAEVEKIWKEI